MMYLLAKWLISALALLAVARLLPGIAVDGLYIALITAAILGVLNLLVRPLLILLTLPVTVLTLGLFIFIINGIIFWFVASFIDGFAVVGFGTAVLGALIVSVISWIGNRLLDNSARQYDDYQ